MNEVDLALLKAERDTALVVAAESFRAALTDPIYENGKACPSIADLAHCRRLTTDGEALANFQLQHLIAYEMKRWLVPPEHRPTCPLDNRPCTSWTCLVDVCVGNQENDGKS